MTMVSSSYVINHDLSQPEVVDLLVASFTGTLQSWWEKHLTDESRASIRSAVKTNEEGIPIFNEKIGLRDSDAVNTLFYTIVEHFIGTPSHLASRVHNQLSNLRCPTLSDFRWYKDVFLSRVMLRDDSNQPFWKEKFINCLPHLFAHKIKEVLVNENNVIKYDNLTYGNIISAIQKEGLKMCIDMEISNQANKDKKKAKYEMGNFCEQYGLPSVAPSKKHRKSRKHEEYRKHKKRFKRFKKRSFEPNDFYKKEKRKPKKRFKIPNNNKDSCYKCVKPGHFAKDCKAKETIKSLKVSNEEKENLIRMLEIKDTEPSDYEFELSISSSESYRSCSSNESESDLDISFGCNDICCKTIGVMNKEEEQEELLLDLISKIENPELKRQYLEKLRKLLTKREGNKSKSLEISLSNMLKRFDKPKEQITIKDLQLEINQIKSEIKILKEENQELKQNVNLLKIEHKLKSAASSPNNSEAESEPKLEDTPPFEENCISLINRIHIKKWYSKVRIKIQDFELSVVVLIDTDADLNCIQEGLVPTKYYSKSKENLRSANGSKMQITFEISKAHVCQDNVCFKTSFVLVKNMTDKVILGLPFITMLYPFTTDQDGLITYPMDEKVKFKFLAKPERSQLNAFKSNSISKTINLIKSKTQQIGFLQEEIKVKRIEEQLSQKTLQQRIQLFVERIKSEVCSDVPTAFWHRKKHIVSLPYIKDFDEGRITTKARPIQMSQEVTEFYRKEMEDLLHKGIIRKIKSPWSCSVFYVQKNAELERGAPRLVINYKPLNKVLEWIRYLIPNKRDLINMLSGSVIFSKFDMKSEFWQIQICKHKIVFVIHFDLSNNFFSSVSKHSIYWICLSLLFDPLKDISKYFSKMVFKHNVISKFWIVSNIFIFQDKMTPPKSLSSTEERKAKSAKILKKWNFPPEIQNPEHLTLTGKGIAKVDYADGPAESLQKVSQQIEFFNLENPKHLTPAEEGTAKVV
jgi:hypothetical protein